MTHTVNAAGRLDRLPVSRFHWKILGLIAGGAFLDAFAPRQQARFPPPAIRPTIAVDRKIVPSRGPPALVCVAKLARSPASRRLAQKSCNDL
ncbi:hypothetical protein [Burkholderia plantarii]|uniref:hypothetical protein n=1 Tax=Burkholderia plantarii TaxID=41899 RepID=UPI0018DCD4F6|nr:hypothetical protein [Burkholderia plantarii]MBI0325459.1 hypothetical protein [Burkholderia plantarii]